MGRTVLSAISVSSRTERSPDSAMVMTGAWSLSNFETTGGRISRGRLRTAMATLSRTSWAATSICAVQVEGDDDDHGAAAGDRAQLLDPLDRVDLLLELLRDLGLHLFGGGAGQLDAHVDRGQVDGREAIDAEPEPAGRAHDDEGHDQHGREHRTLDADFGEFLHGG